MVRSRTNRGAMELPFAFLAGALWGAAMAVLESVLFHQWYRVQLHPLFNLLELILNYALYAGVAALVVYAVVFVVSWLRPARGGEGRYDRVALTESIVGGAAPAVAVANFLWSGPLAAGHHGLVVALVMAAAVLVCWGFLAWFLRVLLPTWRIVIRALLLAWIIAGVLWDPLFGRYDGVFKRSHATAPTGSHPNVLVILTDALRPDFLDCYGASWHASPAADSAAASGVLFENHIAQSTWTLPSTASLLTGQFPSSHGAVVEGLPVSRRSPSLAEAFARAGYRTGTFTENLHVLPRNGFGRGVDTFWAAWLPCVFDQTFLYRITRRFHLPVIGLCQKEAYPENVTSPEQVNWDAHVTTDRVLDWLDGLGDSPFYAYIHYMGPHGPYGPPEYHLDAGPSAVRVIDHPRKKGGGLPLGEKGEPVDEETLRTMKTLYAADILYVEEQIERLFAWLEASGREKQTIVVLTSDHGEEFYEHGAWNHGSSAFDEVLRVPLILTMPGVAKPGVRVETPTRHIDVMPTLLDLAGIDIPDGVQGRSLRPLVEGGRMDPVPAYAQVFPIRPAGCQIESLVTPRHKIINVRLGDRSEVMVFDLAADPEERENLASSQPDVYERLLNDMDAWRGVAHSFEPETDPARLDPGTLEKLRALGYVD